MDNPGIHHGTNAGNWALAQLLDDDDMEDFFMMMIENGEEGHESAEPMGKWGGSVPGRRPNIDRKRAMYNNLLLQDYFVDGCTYTNEQFCRRFRMCQPLFLRILDAVVDHNEYFAQRYDACSVPGMLPHQKICACIQILATGLSADLLDDRYCMGKLTLLKSLKMFCTAVIDVFGTEYLRLPTVQDLERILNVNAKRGFPGMGGSVDCMHVKWKNCPKGWAGLYKGKEELPTIVLEAVVSHDLWFWHAFFGMAGSNNDINVLDQLPLFDNLINGTGPSAHFVLNGNVHSMVYYLGDGIYPEYQTFVKTIPNPVGKKNKLFASMQESVRKDVERAFGVLQSRFHIITMPCKLWDKNAIHTIMIACVILHNMIVEDERDVDGFDNNYLDETMLLHPFVVLQGSAGSNSPDDARKIFCNVIGPTLHCQLQFDLINHLWDHHGKEE